MGAFDSSEEFSGTNLLEVVAQLDDGSCLKHPVLIDDELTVLKRVDVALDEQQIGTALDGQEAATRDIDAVAVLEMLDGSASGGLKLNDCLAVIGLLGVDDDLELHAVVVHDTLQCYEECESCADRMEITCTHPSG